MLRKTNSLKAFALVATLVACAPAIAQKTANSSAAATAAEAAKTPDLTKEFIPYLDLSGVSPEQVKKAQELGASVAQQLLQAYETKRTPEMEEWATKQSRRADDIADAALSAERDKVLEFMGLDPKAESALYIFVSWSMPLEMLRSYAIEAMWSGATLLFKGVPPGKELGEFVLKDLQSLVYGKGAAANISIDPRLFDAYKVTAAPTIVFTNLRTDMSCQGVNPVKFKAKDGQELSYDTCPELDPSVYSKMSGGVTLQYALETFIDGGMGKAKPYRSALARGLATGNSAAKEQKAFTGEWESVLTPSERQRAIEMQQLMSQPLKQTPAK